MGISGGEGLFCMSNIAISESQIELLLIGYRLGVAETVGKKGYVDIVF